MLLFSLRCAGCEAVLCGIEEQVSRANQYRESQLKVKVQVETEVSPSSLQSSVLSLFRLATISPFFPTSHLWYSSFTLTAYFVICNLISVISL